MSRGENLFTHGKKKEQRRERNYIGENIGIRGEILCKRGENNRVEIGILS
jgi:hypothetical protein